ncbi:MAG: DHH family phosphoesterase [Ruminococcaceae bacterium]|nr:DHH family phosphoesterase [Oscillospiraceae bacterium]
MNKRLGRLLRPGMGLYLLFLAVFPVAAFLRDDIALAALGLGSMAMAIGTYLIIRERRKKKLAQYIQNNVDSMNDVRGAKAPFPMLVVRLDDDGIVLANDAFVRLTGFHDMLTERQVTDVLPGFHTEWLSSGKHEYPYDLTLEKRRFRVYGTMITADDPAQTRLGVIYFTDLTELYQVRDEYIRSRPVVSIILVDNYEELTKNLTEGAISTLNARINDAITKWTESYHGLLRKLERNRFLFVFEKRDLKQAMTEKFSILEDIHEITNPSGLPASISFGVGVDAATFEEGYEFAALAIEMSLSRGGDQAVVKDRLNFNFYGGRTKEADHRSKVRSRVTANSLMELIGGSSRVFIMGHKNADLDALGAAMGIACLCRKKLKDFKIVLDLQFNAAKRLIDEIRQVPEYRDVFISGDEALVQCDNRSTLVVVDTNRPDQVECKNLLEAIPKVCVVDHHRRAADYIKPVVVNLHEPYASSAAELVTELLQYAVEKKDVLPIEVKSLMAGIFLDTKSFNVRTGERTFEAAAFLRQLGADTVEVKKLLQNDYRETMAKYEIMRAAQSHRAHKEIAIAALEASTTRILAAQAADELLNIQGITASFVMYPDGDQVIISARSIGEANVQMILEPLGGGGNTATAGAQMRGVTVAQALDRLVASIDQYYEM